MTSEHELLNHFLKKYSAVLYALQPNEPVSIPLSGLDLAFQRPFSVEYLEKEKIAKSFIKHIDNLCGKSQEYFACCTCILQSSGMGKSRLISESWENEELALSILRIDCSKAEERGGVGLETGKFVRFLLALRTQEQMSKLLWCLLFLFLDHSMSMDGSLRDTEKLSKSLDDLGIKFAKSIICIAQLKAIQCTRIDSRRSRTKSPG